MNEKQHYNFWPFVLGFLAGAIVGVLFAPARGEESRKKLQRKAQEAKEKYGSVVSEIREKTSPVIESVAEKVEPVFRKIDEFGNVVKDEIVESLREEDLGLASPPVKKGKEDAALADQSIASAAKPRRKLFFHNLRH